MRVVLINPESPFLIDQDVMPTLGLWYISNALKQKGHQVTIIDMGLGDQISKGADVYGVTGTSAQVLQIKNIADQLRQEQGLKVIGGPHATLCPSEMLDIGFDTVVQHEGEEVICDVVESRTVGIVKAARITNIDHLFPNRTQQKRYYYNIDGRPAVTMITSRGCPGNCAFCSKEVVGNRYISRSTDSVMSEVDSIILDGYQAILFFDDTIMLNRSRLEALCDEIRARDILWRCFARSDQVDPMIMTKMYQSGCREIGIGIESGSQQILDNIHKHETVEQHKRCISLAHEAGLRIKAMLIVGLPGESWDTIRETDQFLEETKPNSLDISILMVYPGTAIYNNPNEYDIKFGEPTYYKGKPGESICNVSTSHMTSQEILLAREMLIKKHKH